MTVSPELILFMLIIAGATYIQTVTGFALAMIAIGTVSSFDLAPIAFTSVVISLVSITNGCFALRGKIRSLPLKEIRYCFLGMLPSVVFGLWLLDHLSDNFTSTLQVLLGLTIIGGGVVLMLRPDPIEKISSPVSFSATGLAAGLMAGLFSLAGPPLVYQFYRQPMMLHKIRHSLIALFLISHLIRTSLVGIQGELTIEMFTFSAFAIPVVAIFTWLGQKYPPPLNSNNLRRFAFLLLVIIGISLLI